MHRKVVLVLVVALLLAIGYRVLSKHVHIICCCIEDIDHKGMREIIFLTGDGNSEYMGVPTGTSRRPRPIPYGKKLIIFSLSSDETIRELSLEELKPWKIQTADVDGDNIKELSIGVYKTARFHEVEDKRPFIYNLHPEGISPKWLGSRLSRPFDDYVFGDIDQDNKDELISIEVLSNGKKVVNAYQWKGFGFESIGESTPFHDISRIKTTNSRNQKECKIKARIKMEQKWKWIVLVYEDNRLIINE